MFLLFSIFFSFFDRAPLYKWENLGNFNFKTKYVVPAETIKVAI